jgi:flagellar basal-body rod protein FlgB
MELLANNLANADTPNFKARDIDFREALAAAATPNSAAQLNTTQPNHISTDPSGADAANLKYRVPLAPSLDGNTVDSQMEESAFAENNVRYEAALTFIEGKFSDLNTVISD